MALSDVVNVVVNISSSTVAQQGFGTPLIFGHHPNSERVLTFKASTWKESMLAAGITATEAVYACADALMKQSPRPETFKVGRRSVAETQVVRLIPQNVSGSAELTFDVTIEAAGGLTETATFTTDASPTLAEVNTGLAAAINALTVPVTADGSSGTWVVVTADTPDRVHSYIDLKGLLLEDHTVVTSGVGIATPAEDLTAIKEADNDWYALSIASSAPSLIEAAADWIESEPKIFVTSTHDSRPLTNSTTDIVSSIKTQGYDRTHVAYNSKAGAFYGAAWTAVMLPYEPGQATWKFMAVKGVPADKLTAQQETYLLGKNGSYYEPLIRGRDSAGAALGGSGVFIDLTQIADWATARVIEGIAAMLTSAPKVPFTDQGAGNSIWGVLNNVLQMGIRNEAIDDDPETSTIVVPKRAQLSTADRAAWRWTGCSLSFVPSGAVHSVGLVTININVTG